LGFAGINQKAESSRSESEEASDADDRRLHPTASEPVVKMFSRLLALKLCRADGACLSAGGVAGKDDLLSWL
jgi:hypothetical protein